MKLIAKKIIIVIVIAIISSAVYFGAYLPFKKARAFIAIGRSLQKVRSVEELQSKFDRVLNIKTSVAHDEVLSFFADQMAGIIRSGPPKPIGQALIDYTINRITPVLENEASPELTKMLLKAAIVYQTGWLLYGDEKYFQQAEFYLLQGLEKSPNRPQFLYGLFDLYSAKKENAKALGIGETIIRLWPKDSYIKEKVQLLPEPPQ